MFGAYLIETHMILSETGHRLVELGIFLFTYGFVSLWLKANSRAIIHEDLERWKSISRTSDHALHPQSKAAGSKSGISNRRTRSVWKSIREWLRALASSVADYFL
jgi:hypothetical protein